MLKLIRKSDGSLSVQKKNLALEISQNDGTGLEYRVVNVRDAGKGTEGRRYFGMLGVIRLVLRWYALMIQRASVVGQICGHDVYRVDGMQCVAVSGGRAEDAATEEEEALEQSYRQQLDAYLISASFYFSHTLALTHSLQRIFGGVNEIGAGCEEADRRFYWNQAVAEPLEDAGAGDFVVPVIDGMVFVKEMRQDGSDAPFTYALVSRRDCRRTGARFQTRGVDPQGHVANFVETEQIVARSGAVSSFVQVRGSIPLLWHQKGKAFKPKPRLVATPPMQQRALRAHAEELCDVYGGAVLMVNLVDAKGAELVLREAFESHVLLLGSADVRYVGFDFHARVKGNPSECLASLMQRIAVHTRPGGFFLRDAAGRVVNVQAGVVRTNCVDSLDRTNVLQSEVARQMLPTQLGCMAIAARTAAELGPAFDAMLKNLWADHADVMSQRYTGTGALKTDYTRTGKRSVRGIMNDGFNAGVRMFNKVSRDDERQYMSDVVLGRIRIERLPNVYALIAEINSLANPELSPLDMLAALDPLSDNSASFERSDARLRQLRRVLAGSRTRSGTRLFSCSLVRGVLDQAPNAAPAVLMLDETRRILTSIILELRSAKSVPIDDIIMAARPPNGPRMLAIRTRLSAFPIEFLFPSVAFLQAFIAALLSLSPISLISPKPGPLYITNKHNDKDDDNDDDMDKKGFSLFIGCWNMNNVERLTMLDCWIPRGVDLYAIGIQHCRVEVPDGIDLRPAAFVAHMIMAHLGPDMYEEVALMQCGSGALLVVASSELAPYLHNARPVHVCPNSALGDPSDATLLATPKDGAETIVERTLTRLLGGGGGGGAPADKSGHSSPYLGSALAVVVGNTPICLVHSAVAHRSQPELSGRARTNAWLELGTDFHHVFWVGEPHPDAVDGTRWVALAGPSPAGTVSWRSAPNAGISRMESRHDVGMPNTAHQPVAVQCLVPVESHAPPFARDCVALRLSGMVFSYASAALLDAPLVLTFGAPFIEDGCSTDASLRSSAGAEWRTPRLLRTFVAGRRCLAALYLRVALGTAGEDLGFALVSLRDAALRDVTPVAFRAQISLNDVAVGMVTGKITVLERAAPASPSSSSPSPPPSDDHVTSPLIDPDSTHRVLRGSFDRAFSEDPPAPSLSNLSIPSDDPSSEKPGHRARRNSLRGKRTSSLHTIPPN